MFPPYRPPILRFLVDPFHLHRVRRERVRADDHLIEHLVDTRHTLGVGTVPNLPLHRGFTGGLGRVLSVG
jgi:hypothetical protein